MRRRPGTYPKPHSLRSQFGKLFSLKVDGAIYAQPLYMPGPGVRAKYGSFFGHHLSVVGRRFSILVGCRLPAQKASAGPGKTTPPALPGADNRPSRPSACPDPADHHSRFNYSLLLAKSVLELSKAAWLTAPSAARSSDARNPRPAFSQSLLSSDQLRCGENRSPSRTFSLTHGFTLIEGIGRFRVSRRPFSQS